VSKGTYYSVKRDLLTYSVKRDLLRVNRDLLPVVQCQLSPHVSKETYRSKRDLHQEVSVSKKTYYSVERDLLRVNVKERPSFKREHTYTHTYIEERGVRGLRPVVQCHCKREHSHTHTHTHTEREREREVSVSQAYDLWCNAIVRAQAGRFTLFEFVCDFVRLVRLVYCTQKTGPGSAPLQWSGLATRSPIYMICISVSKEP
jgi:hypothetical protein